MPDRELLLEYQTVMQNTRVIQLYGELLAFMRETARATADLRDSWRVSAVHPGKLDASYFTVVTPASGKRKGKYVVALLHGELTFELWLCGTNQKALGEIRKANFPFPAENQRPVPEEWIPFVAACWKLGDSSLLEAGAQALAEKAEGLICKIDESLR